MSDDVLVRFHDALVGSLMRRVGGDLQRPFTVAEIYHDLVPYREFRDRLGVEMNGDYEHALLRLLAGEGEFVELESEHALREIREELQSVNPNTGLYREFAAVDARLNPTRIPENRDVAAPAPEPPPPAPAEAVPAVLDLPDLGWEASPPVTASPAAPVPEAPVDAEPLDPEPEPEPVSQSDSAPDVCPWCRETLPKRDNLSFCPFCGTDVKLVPCGSCGEALEPGWRFCIACGTPASED